MQNLTSYFATSVRRRCGMTDALRRPRRIRPSAGKAQGKAKVAGRNDRESTPGQGRWIVTVAALVLAGAGWVDAAPNQADPSTPGWHVYRNNTYRYEIAYPPGYELWPTGPKSQRDGRNIRIGRENHSALTPMLDVEVSPRTPAQSFPMPLPDLRPDLVLITEDIDLNGRPARRAVYRWKESGDLSLVVVYRDGVVFRFMASHGMREIDRSDWWQIIASFRERRK